MEQGCLVVHAVLHGVLMIHGCSVKRQREAGHRDGHAKGVDGRTEIMVVGIGGSGWSEVACWSKLKFIAS